jgi:hypothetical protein
VHNPFFHQTLRVAPQGALGGFIMRSLSLVGLAGSAVLLSAGMVHANNADWASQIISYNPGTSSSAYSVGSYYQNSSGWYGYLQPNGGGAYPSGSYTLTPFEAAYDNNDLLGIGPGGKLELQFVQVVTTSTGVNGGFNIGVHAGVALEDASGASYSGSVGPIAALYTNPREADVAVSQNGINWIYAIGTTGWTSDISHASPIIFDIPSNYYNDASIAPDGPDNIVQDDDYPNDQTADFSLPFTGMLSSFDGLSDYEAVLNKLNGSAGGTWLNLSGTGLTSIEYLELCVPDNADYNMYLQAAVGVAPEPGSLSLLLLGGMALVCRRRARKL